MTPTPTVAVPVRELKMFRKIIQREADAVFSSYKDQSTGTISDSTPTFIMREYLEMKRSIGKLDEFIAGSAKAGRK
jgi:hypothetical protein